MSRHGPLALALGLLVAALSLPAWAEGERLAVSQDPIVWIPTGAFFRGSSQEGIDRARQLCLPGPTSPLPRCPDELLSSERPARKIWLSAYGMDRREASLRSYRECVRAGGCAPSRIRPDDSRLSGPDMPVAGITWHEARAYCRYRQGRLPTEAEWERAARGEGARMFPWGGRFQRGLANHGDALGMPDGTDGFLYAAPTGSFPKIRSPHGLLDVAGNVWEWTQDGFRHGAYGVAPEVDPAMPPDGPLRVVRGGSWLSAPHTLRTTHREPRAAAGAWPDVGVRCAYDEPRKPGP